MKHIKSVVVLVCICAAVSLMLAVTNLVTAPIIEANENAAANAALLEVMPQGKDFKKVDLGAYTLPATVTEAYSEAGGGYVIRLVTTGYGSGMSIMCGVNADGTVSGALCLSSNETLGFEKTYGQNFAGKDSAGVSAVDTVSGATLTTKAYRSAVVDAINTATILGGGSADLRSEEEILADNLSEALPSAEGKFTRLFIVEAVEMDEIKAIYSADNGVGYVAIVGDSFVGTDEGGKVISTDVSEDIKANVENVMAVLIAAATENIDLAAYEGLPSQLVSAQKTATGNYVIEIKAAGYGIAGGDDYHPASGEYIYVKVSATADGKIIDCLTLSQQESKNIGDACANESFYGQFDGKTEADYKDIDAISGATITTDGYVKAIGRVFNVIKILEGGASDEN